MTTENEGLQPTVQIEIPNDSVLKESEDHFKTFGV